MDELIEIIEKSNLKTKLATGVTLAALGLGAASSLLHTKKELTPDQVKEIGLANYQVLKKAYEDGQLDKAAGYVYQEVVGQPKEIVDKMLPIIASLLKANSSNPEWAAKKKLIAYKTPDPAFVDKFKKIYADSLPIRYVYHSFSPTDKSIDIGEYVPKSWVSSYWAGDAKPIEIEVTWGKNKERKAKRKFYKLSDIKKDGKSPYEYQKRIGDPDSGAYYIYKEKW